MISLFIILVPVTFVFWGIGSLSTKLLRLSVAPDLAILLGFVIANIISTLVSLWIPITPSWGLLLFCFATFGWIKRYVHLTTNTFSKWPIGIKLVCVVSVLIILLLSVSIPQNFDTHLYHLQSIRWTAKYAAVPGLANLHSRLGFNAQLFSLYPAFSFQEMLGQEILWVNPFLSLVIFLTFFFRGISAFQSKGDIYKSIGYGILLIGNIPLNPDLSSASPDLPVNLLIGYVITTCLELLGKPFKNKVQWLMVLFSLSIWVVSCKLSAWALPLFPLMGLGFIGFNRNKRIVLGLITIVVLTPWMIKNYIISGFIIYPVWLPFNINGIPDWSVPASVAIQEVYSVIGWARHPGSGYKLAAQADLVNWFPHWWNAINKGYKVWLLCCGFFPIFWILKKGIKTKFNPWHIYYLMVWLALLIWLYGTPDFRLGLEWMVLALALPFFYPLKYIHHTPLIKTLGLLLLCLWPLGIGITASQRLKAVMVQSMHKNRIWMPAWQPTPAELKMDTILINSAIIIRPMNDQRCFEIPLPCTPYLSPNLHMRGTSIQEGFSVK